MPKVSVVIPAYNAHRTLGDTLDSVLAQSYRDWEAIVVDDGSTDDTTAKAASFRDPRIRIVRQRNRGLSGARNTGIRLARGSLIAFLDADDLWHRDKLARHLAHLQARPDVGVSFSPSEMIDAEGNPLGYRQKPQLRNIDAATVLCRNPVGNGSAAVVRQTALAQIAFYDRHSGHTDLCFFNERLRQSEDVECWVRLASTTSWQLEGVAEALTFYRIHSGALSADIEEQFRTWHHMLDQVSGYAPDLARRYRRLAEAYQLRYLARRAVRSRQARGATRLITAALLKDWRISVLEFRRTWTTALAVVLLRSLPESVYGRLEKTAMRLA